MFDDVDEEVRECSTKEKSPRSRVREDDPATCQ